MIIPQGLSNMVRSGVEAVKDAVDDLMGDKDEKKKLVKSQGQFPHLPDRFDLLHNFSRQEPFCSKCMQCYCPACNFCMDIKFHSKFDVPEVGLLEFKMHVRHRCCKARKKRQRAPCCPGLVPPFRKFAMLEYSTQNSPLKLYFQSNFGKIFWYGQLIGNIEECRLDVKDLTANSNGLSFPQIRVTGLTEKQRSFVIMPETNKCPGMQRNVSALCCVCCGYCKETRNIYIGDSKKKEILFNFPNTRKKEERLYNHCSCYYTCCNGCYETTNWSEHHVEFPQDIESQDRILILAGLLHLHLCDTYYERIKSHLIAKKFDF